jgi:hypothetical protein
MYDVQIVDITDKYARDSQIYLTMNIKFDIHYFFCLQIVLAWRL